MHQRKTSYPQKVLIDRIQCVYNTASVSLPYMLPCLEDPAKEEAGRMEELEDREKGSQAPPSKHSAAMVTVNSQQLCLYALGSHTLALLITNCKGERFSQG